MDQLKTPVIIIVFFFICLFIFTKLFGPIPFTVNSIQTVNNNLFTVQGVGKEKAVADTAMVSLGVTVTASSAQEAKNQINTTTNKIVADLKKLGIEEKDIKTVNLSVYPNTPSTPQPLTPDLQAPVSLRETMIASYTGSETIEVTTKSIELANKAIDVATQNGANTLGTPTFVINEEKRKELTKLARKKAIVAAKQQAEQLASEAGIRLGNVVNVQENSAGGIYYGAMTKEQDVSSDQRTELNAGENEVVVTVTLSYETR